MASIIYGIMCHKSAKHVQEQYQLLCGPNIQFIYHADAKAPATLKALLARIAVANSNVKILTSAHCSWAGFSLTRTMLRIVEVATTLEGWEHLVFLSEEHLPLRSPKEIVGALDAETDYVEASPYERFYEQGKLDIQNRFARVYRELQGVGAFATEEATLDDAFFKALHHGSQWMTLSRTTCLQLLQTANRPFYDKFEHSLLSDETAFQSWVANLHRRGGVTRRKAITTYVADPSRGGSADMTFGEDLFFTAQDKGFLFIRKRSDTMPPRIVDYFDQTMPVEERPTAIVIDDIPPQFNQSLSVDCILERLNILLSPYAISMTKLPYRGLPSVSCKITYQDLQDQIKIYLLSEDAYHFKLIAIQPGYVSGFAEASIGDYATSVVRARVRDMSFFQELHIAPDFNYGFHVVDGKNDLEGLATLAQLYVARVQALQTG